MDRDGGNKTVLFAQTGRQPVRNICWTNDGKFIVFTIGPDNDKNKQVMAVNLESGKVSELTKGFTEGSPQSLWCAPDHLGLVYAPIAVNPDLYRAELEASGDGLSIKSVSRLTENKHYRRPDWVSVTNTRQ